MYANISLLTQVSNIKSRVRTLKINNRRIRRKYLSGRCVNIILAIFYILASTSGLIFIKLGNNQVKSIVSFNRDAIQMEIGYLTIIGLLFYITSFILFLVIVTRHNLSYIFPLLAGCVYVTVFIASVIFLKEKISYLTVGGMVVILIGILILNLEKILLK